jgi:ADP-heptose:LPS heptosyltransferase
MDEDVELISLQKVVRGRDVTLLAQSRIRSFVSEINDFSDTAALMQTLDLLVTVDTAVAHLAGALDLPLWVLLPDPPEWRWMRERSDSPWYPRARLFRQPAPGRWDAVVAAVRDAIRQLR